MSTEPESEEQTMTFKLLHEGIDCNCIESATENGSSIFLRRIDKEEVRERDFYSLWERYAKQGKDYPRELKHCKDKCEARGVSVDKFDNTNETFVEMCKVARSFCPVGRKYFCKFTLSANSGVFNYSPTEKSDVHHDLYKCDAFTLACVSVIGTCEIPSNSQS